MEEKINFHSENNFEIKEEKRYSLWISEIISSEKKELEEINYIFCDDEYLFKLNEDYLDHDTYTDIISFDYSIENLLQGDIYISTERVEENAVIFKVSFDEELRRVLSHGILHLCGYKDKSEEDCLEMRNKENEKMKMFHVEQS